VLTPFFPFQRDYPRLEQLHLTKQLQSIKPVLNRNDPANANHQLYHECSREQAFPKHSDKSTTRSLHSSLQLNPQSSDAWNLHKPAKLKASHVVYR
jgi:hypothetical protein